MLCRAIFCRLKAKEPHYQGDVLDVLEDGWDMMIAHPPCTYLASSGLHWNKKRPERALKTEAALEFITTLCRTYQEGSFGKSGGLHQHTTQVYAEASICLIPICLEMMLAKRQGYG